MQQTSIGWTDFSANLLKYRNAAGKTVWACVHASEGCRFCYSEALAKRWGRGEAFTAENMKALTPYFDTDEASQILKSKKITGKKVFVDDMTDLFGEWVNEDIIRAHFATFAARPDVTFQLLTKRAKRMCETLKGWQREGLTLREGCGAVLPNVHLGVSVEDQKNADERIPLLMKTPSAVKWVSAEPLLGAIDLEMLTDGPDDGCGWIYRHWNALDGGNWCDCMDHIHPIGSDPIDGIVIGGESGEGHREMPLTEALVLAESARAAGVSVYVKQDSGPRPGMQGRIPDDVWAMKAWPNSATATTGISAEV